MPKDGRVNSLSFDQAGSSPYACSSKNSNHGKYKSPFRPGGDEKEWEQARCPICMEHPHNAVLLLCSSSEKGCRPYMCDTSYRHSNCLDQFRKSNSLESVADVANLFPSSRRGPWIGREILVHSQPARSAPQQPKLVCPLCRGQVTGWVVIEPARKFMNSKSRTCSLESCNFRGTYSNLRKHARLEHPSAKPSEADLSRQSEWMRLEHQRDFEDTLSAYHSFGNTLEDDALLYDEQNGSISDFLSEVVSEDEDEWNVGGYALMDFEFELDFSFLSDISFSSFDEGLDFSRVTGSQVRNQRPTRPRSNNETRSIHSRRRNTSSRRWGATTPSRGWNFNLSSSESPGPRWL